MATLSCGSRRLAIVAALIITVVGSSRSARAADPDPDPDPWLGRDKVAHFAVSSALATSGYVVGAALLDARGHALIIGGGLAFGAGIAKELLDLAGLGDPSLKDLTWDAIGTASGLAVAWGVDLLVRGVSPRHPLLVAPRIEREGAGLQVVVRF